MTHVPVIVSLGLIFASIARPASPVAVLLQFDQAYSRPAIEAMQREAGAILSPAGYQLEWHLLASELAGREYPDLVVVHLRGNCAAGPATGVIANGEALASTAVADGQVLPFSEVQCDQVRRLLGAYHAAGTLGRALGRVVAHEMFHMLAATERHGKDGVARPSYTTQELVSDGAFRFHGPDLQLLQETHRRAP